MYWPACFFFIAHFYIVLVCTDSNDTWSDPSTCPRFSRWNHTGNITWLLVSWMFIKCPPLPPLPPTGLRWYVYSASRKILEITDLTVLPLQFFGTIAKDLWLHRSTCWFPRLLRSVCYERHIHSTLLNIDYFVSHVSNSFPKPQS